MDVHPLSGKWITTPFSATTPSTKCRSPATRRNSSRILPVTSSTDDPVTACLGDRISDRWIHGVAASDGPVIVECDDRQLHNQPLDGSSARGASTSLSAIVGKTDAEGTSWTDIGQSYDDQP